MDLRILDLFISNGADVHSRNMYGSGVFSFLPDWNTREDHFQAIWLLFRGDYNLSQLTIEEFTRFGDELLRQVLVDRQLLLLKMLRHRKAIKATSISKMGTLTEGVLREVMKYHAHP